MILDISKEILLQYAKFYKTILFIKKRKSIRLQTYIKFCVRKTYLEKIFGDVFFSVGKS